MARKTAAARSRPSPHRCRFDATSQSASAWHPTRIAGCRSEQWRERWDRARLAMRAGRVVRLLACPCRAISKRLGDSRSRSQGVVSHPGR